MKKHCDLHVHSWYSDGTCSPAQLLDEAEKIGLSAIALTDHNTVDGLSSFLEAAQGRGVEAVPGIEFSVDYMGIELHLLGLYIRPQHYWQLTAMLDDDKRRKEQSNIDLAKALNRAGYKVDYEKIKAGTNEGFVNRAHFASQLVELGYAESVRDAFSRLLHPSAGYYVAPQRQNVFDIIRYFKSIGSAAVLAHPFLQLDEAALRGFLLQAVPAGLDGMETLYPRYNDQTTALAQKIADEFGILPSGGSDFHGANKPDISLGCGTGDLAVPASYLEAIRNRCKVV